MYLIWEDFARVERDQLLAEAQRQRLVRSVVRALRAQRRADKAVAAAARADRRAADAALALG